MKKEKLLSVEIWDPKNKFWCDYSCPRGETVEDYIDWCIGAESVFWATVNTPEDKIRLNGWYVIDGSDHYCYRM